MLKEMTAVIGPQSLAARRRRRRRASMAEAESVESESESGRKDSSHGQPPEPPPLSTPLPAPPKVIKWQRIRSRTQSVTSGQLQDLASPRVSHQSSGDDRDSLGILSSYGTRHQEKRPSADSIEDVSTAKPNSSLVAARSIPHGQGGWEKEILVNTASGLKISRSAQEHYPAQAMMAIEEEDEEEEDEEESEGRDKFEEQKKVRFHL